MVGIGTAISGATDSRGGRGETPLDNLPSRKRDYRRTRVGFLVSLHTYERKQRPDSASVRTQ